MIISQNKPIEIDQFENGNQNNLIANAIFENRVYKDNGSYYKLFIFITSKDKQTDYHLDDFTFNLKNSDESKKYSQINENSIYNVKNKDTEDRQFIEYHIPEKDLDFKSDFRFVYSFNHKDDFVSYKGYIDLKLPNMIVKEENNSWTENLIPVCFYQESTNTILSNEISLKTPVFKPLKTYKEIMSAETKYNDYLPQFLDKNIDLVNDIYYMMKEVKPLSLDLNKFTIQSNSTIISKYVSKPKFAWDKKRLISSNKSEYLGGQIIEGNVNDGFMFIDSKKVKQNLLFEIDIEQYTIQYQTEVLNNDSKNIILGSKYKSEIKFIQTFLFNNDFLLKVRNDNKYNYINEVINYEK